MWSFLDSVSPVLWSAVAIAGALGFLNLAMTLVTKDAGASVAGAAVASCTWVAVPYVLVRVVDALVRRHDAPHRPGPAPRP